MIDAGVLKSLLEMGTAAIYLYAVMTLWNALKSSHEAHLNDLRRIVFQQPSLPPRTPPTATASIYAPSLN